MCMIGDDDTWDLYTKTHPRARIPHCCAECRLTIITGETYERVTGLSNGRWYTYRTCHRCVAAREWLNYFCGGWVHTGVLEDLRTHTSGHDEDYLHSADLGTLVDLMTRQWVTDTGDLLTATTVASLTRQAIAASQTTLDRQVQS